MLCSGFQESRIITLVCKLNKGSTFHDLEFVKFDLSVYVRFMIQRIGFELLGGCPTKMAPTKAFGHTMNIGEATNDSTITNAHITSIVDDAATCYSNTANSLLNKVILLYHLSHESQPVDLMCCSN